MCAACTSPSRLAAWGHPAQCCNSRTDCCGRPQLREAAHHNKVPVFLPQIFIAMVSVCLMLAADRANVVIAQYDDVEGAGALRTSAQACMAGQVRGAGA